MAAQVASSGSGSGRPARPSPPPPSSFTVIPSLHSHATAKARIPSLSNPTRSIVDTVAATPRRVSKRRHDGSAGRDIDGTQARSAIIADGMDEASVHREFATAKLRHPYELQDCIGKGAFGTVYRAISLDDRCGGKVAVKRIQTSSAEERGLLTAELRLLQHLRHDNIVRSYDAAKTERAFWIVMEYCQNGSLAQLCKRFGKLPERLAARYVRQALTGLAYLHEQGIVHRDIKAANILSMADGTVKLADFGLAAPTGASTAGQPMGSPYWAAPEIIERRQAVAASDIWAMGCVACELVGGDTPYGGLQPMTALFRIVSDVSPPMPANVSPALEDFLRACFEKDPARRISAQSLLAHIWLEHEKESKRASTSMRVGRQDGDGPWGNQHHATPGRPLATRASTLPSTLYATSAEEAKKTSSLDSVSATPAAVRPGPSLSHDPSSPLLSVSKKRTRPTRSATLAPHGSICSSSQSQQGQEQARHRSTSLTADVAQIEPNTPDRGHNDRSKRLRLLDTPSVAQRTPRPSSDIRAWAAAVTPPASLSRITTSSSSCKSSRSRGYRRDLSMTALRTTNTLAAAPSDTHSPISRQSP